jgi:NAD(P)H-dependent flavin oxidoreductase YrpB (nitropropane dioxygenase family)
MTYSIDIINLSIYHYNVGLKKIQICKLLNITNKTFYNWYDRYNNYYINNIQLTTTGYNEIKNNQEHKSTKKTKYSNLIVDYVNNNIGCSLYDINENINNATNDFIKTQLDAIEQFKNGNISKIDAQLKIEHYWAGALRRAVIDGDIENGSLMAGQSVGFVVSEQPSAEIIRELIDQANGILNAN